MRNSHLFVIGIAFLLNNCTTNEPRMSAADFPSNDFNGFYLDQQSDDVLSESIPQQSEEPLSLENAVALTLLHNPSLQIYPYEIRSIEALAMQAGLYPNPELEMAAEDLAGTGDFEIGNGVEITTLYSQLIERGNKRENRYQLGLWETEVARWDYRIAKTDVLTEMAQRYIDVLSAQENVKLLKELVSIGKEALYAVSERVRTGRVAPLEETRAKVELAVEQNALDHAEQELLAAMELLNALWGNHSTYTSVTGSLENKRDIPELNFLLQQIESNPEMQQWAVESKRRQSALVLEQSQAVPDITVGGGVRYLNEPGDGTLVVGVSMPLMLFNRNQGGIRAAQEQIDKAIQEKKAQYNQIQSQLISQYQNLIGSHKEVNRLKNEILPDSENAYNAAREGYQQGKFDFLNVIDAQRTLFQVRVGYLQSLTLLQHQWINLERLTGAPLQDVVEQSSIRSDKNETK